MFVKWIQPFFINSCFHFQTEIQEEIIRQKAGSGIETDLKVFPTPEMTKVKFAFLSSCQKSYANLLAFVMPTLPACNRSCHTGLVYVDVILQAVRQTF